MIIVSGAFNTNPDKHAEAVTAFTEMATATQQEEGCITYSFYEDVTTPNRFLVYEEWETADHLTAHGKTAHMADLRAKMPALIVKGEGVKKYTANLIES